MMATTLKKWKMSGCSLVSSVVVGGSVSWRKRAAEKQMMVGMMERVLPPPRQRNIHIMPTIGQLNESLEINKKEMLFCIFT